MRIGFAEAVVVLLAAMVFIGPEKLPAYARKFGAALREFRKASADVTQEIRESVIDPLEEAQKPLREAMEPLEDLRDSLKADARSVEKDLRNIGKTETKKPAEPDAEKEDSPAPAEEPGAADKGGEAP